MKKIFAAIALVCCLILVSCKTKITNYKITYHDEDTITEIQYSPNEVIPNKDILGSSKEGYELEGWYFDASYSSVVTFPYTVTKDEDFYARWIELHTVKFMVGDTVLETIKIKHNQSVSTLPTPEQAGSTFIEWCTDEDLTTSFDKATPITEDKILYAKFEDQLFTVTFINDNVEYDKKSVVYNNSVTAPEKPSKPGFSFKGWSTKEDEFVEFDFSAKITQATILYAFFTKESAVDTFTVTYKYNDTTYTTQTVNSNSATEAPKDPIITGFSFVEWCIDEDCKTPFDFSTKITSDITLYAKLEPITTHTLTLIIDEQKINSQTLQVQINDNFTIDTLDLPIKEGYEVQIWFTDSTYATPFDATTKITEDMTLYGITTVKVLKVSFINGTELYETKAVSYKSTVSFPTNPSKVGHTFKGWSTKQNEYVEFKPETQITEDITLYAYFTINTYTVTFKDGETTLKTVTVDYNSSVTLPPLSDKTGYTTKGWSTKANSFVEFTADTKITEDITLYAYYEIKRFVVTFMDGNLTVATRNTIAYNSSVGLAMPQTPTKTGYTFKGWSTNATSYVEFTADTKVTSNITVYAHYSIQTFTVTFMDGSYELSKDTVDYNSTAAIPTAPTKTGYTFKGWSTNATSYVKFDTESKITSNLTVYAYYVQVFTVTFNVDGTKTTTQVESGNKVTKPEDPAKSGYTFTGWYLNNSEFNFNTSITANIELVARFTEEQEVQIEIPNYNGYNEGIFFEATPVVGASLSDYSVNYKLADASSWKKVDQQLIREKNGKIRCDIIGLAAGSYQVKIDAKGKTRTISCEVSEDDRSGYAHFNNTTGVGAYKNDGTLKSNAVVVYVTDATKNTVKATIGGKEYTGLVKIIQACTKSSYALDIRVLGEIQTTQWNFKEHGTGKSAERQASLDALFNFSSTQNSWDSTSSGNYYKLNEAEIKSLGINSMSDDEAKGITKLEGLTNQVLRDKTPDSKSKVCEYDSYYNMLDVAGAYNITIEGIGTDAAIFQWGFAFKKCNSIEIKNLRFYNYTEDAVGFEGGSSSDNNYGNYWVHNCTFDIGVNNWDVCYENDKMDGDGSSDVKYCHNVTISYVQYNKTHKTNLIGSSDSALQYNITLHHNYYNNCGSRLPLVRQTNIHMYNNYYYKSTGYSNSIRANCYAFVENCYYEAGQNPYEVVTSDSYKGTAIKAYNNEYNNVKLSGSSYKSGNTVSSRTASVTSGCKPDGSTDYSNFDTNATLFYYDTTKHVSDVKNLLNPGDVPSHCKTYSGVLKANAKGFDAGASTPIEPDPTPGDETWTNKLNETFSTNKTPQHIEMNVQIPTGISYCTDAANTTQNNATIENGALHINDTSTKTTYAYYTFDQANPTSGKVRVSVDFTIPVAGTKWTILTFRDGNGDIMIRTNEQGKLGYVVNGERDTNNNLVVNPIDSSSIVANTVYTVTLIVDYSAGTATVQINDTKVTLSNYTVSGSILGLSFMTAASATNRSFTVDNIKVDWAN
ncbi:MAG: InlB B-repeat-containing protein [Anaeroplasmataceae bacterium]|nr:InlB B-repeat-containing protein [Anaeroplasmataceae bacterium]MDE6414497.1 InlB B-repeat-containing protein [Anaeroplasmataceae bacterium]